MGWLPPTGFPISTERPKNSSVAFINGLRKKYSDDQLKSLFSLIEEWSTLQHDMADKFDKGVGLDAANYGTGQQDSAKRKTTEEQILKIINKDELETIRGMRKYVAGWGGPFMSGGKSEYDKIGSTLHATDEALTKYADLMQGSIAAAKDPAAKRKEIHDSLQAIIDSEQERRKGNLLTDIQNSRWLNSVVGSTNPLTNKQNAFIKAISDAPGFDASAYQTYDHDATEANNEEMAHELLNRLDNDKLFASVKINGLPAGTIPNVPAAPAIPSATPEQIAANKAKAEVAKSGRFGTAEEDKLPVFYVPKDGPIKQGDLVDIEIGGKKVRAIAMSEAEDLPKGIHAQISPGLAQALGIAPGTTAEINYAKVSNEPDANKRIDIASSLYNQMLQNAQVAATPPAPSAPGAVLPPPPALSGAVPPGTITPPGAAAPNAPAPAPQFVIDPNRALNPATFSQLGHDLTDTYSNDFGKMHDRIAEMEQIPGLAAELDVLKTKIANANQRYGIDITSSGDETHFVSSGASWVVRDLEEAALQNDGKITLDEAKAIVLATAEAVEHNTTSHDSDAVQGGLLSAIKQAHDSGASAADIVAVGKGAKPQNLVMAGGTERAPGS